MNRKISSVLLLLILAACGTKKRTVNADPVTIRVEASDVDEEVSDEAVEEDVPLPENEDLATPDAVNSIINTALAYSGVRYKYGGTSETGMDCSGLLYVAFKAHDISLPRVSHEMAEQGKRIRVDDIDKGDLLFFTTTRRGRRINHVGLVVAVDGDDIKFIHSTSSRGVIVSSLREGFWNYAFVKATRVL